MMVEGWRGGDSQLFIQGKYKYKDKDNANEFYKANVRSMHVMMVDGLERIAFDASLKYENS